MFLACPMFGAAALICFLWSPCCGGGGALDQLFVNCNSVSLFVLEFVFSGCKLFGNCFWCFRFDWRNSCLVKAS